MVGGHEGFDYGELRAATAALRSGARLFATGRDPVYPGPTGPEPATGAIVAAIETAGGVPAVVVGKPEPIMFDIAREALAGCQRIANIGDNLTTDIAGAKRAGLDAILVLTGATVRADLEAAAIRPDLVLDNLASVPAAITAAGPGGRAAARQVVSHEPGEARDGHGAERRADLALRVSAQASRGLQQAGGRRSRSTHPVPDRCCSAANSGSPRQRPPGSPGPNWPRDLALWWSLARGRWPP